jgi:hypothetical protein
VRPLCKERVRDPVRGCRVINKVYVGLLHDGPKEGWLAKTEGTMHVDVIIPALNEAQSVAAVVQAIPRPQVGLQSLRYAEVPVRYRRRIGRSKISGTVRGALGAGLKIILLLARYELVRSRRSSCS